MRRLLLVAVSFLTALSIAGEPTPRQKLPVGTARPKLDFRLLDGSKWPGWDAMRGRVVVVDFWASWCSPCVAAIPHLDALKKELAGQPVTFYAITYEPRNKARAFLEKHPMTTLVGLDNDLATFQSTIAWGIPMTIVFDREGRVAAVVNPLHLTAAQLREVLAGRIPEVKPHPGWNDPAGAAEYFRAQLEEDRKKYGKE